MKYILILITFLFFSCGNNEETTKNSNNWSYILSENYQKKHNEKILKLEVFVKDKKIIIDSLDALKKYHEALITPNIVFNEDNPRGLVSYVNFKIIFESGKILEDVATINFFKDRVYFLIYLNEEGGFTAGLATTVRIDLIFEDEILLKFKTFLPAGDLPDYNYKIKN